MSLIMMSLIPKIIFTFWHDPEIPDIVSKCIATWSKFNPSYKIIVMSEVNYRDYCPIDVLGLKHMTNEYRTNKTRMSDIIRTIILKTYGGIWMDASIICTGSLDSLIELGSSKGFLAYTMESRDEFPIIENWFIACSKDNEFMKMWYDEFIIRAASFESLAKYVEISNKHIKVRGGWTGQYFTMHTAAQVLIQINKYPLDRLVLLSACEGPFKIFCDNNWKSEEALTKLSVMTDVERPKPIIKLVGTTRDLLRDNKELSDVIFNNLDLNKNIKENFKNNGSFYYYILILMLLLLLIYKFC